jgi:hypothetical protein
MITAVLIWGCTQNSPSESALSDEQLIEQAIIEIESDETADFFYDDVDEESEENFVDAGDGFLAKPIIPFRFGRVRMHPVVKDIHIVFDTDSTATVSFRKVIRGKFVSLVGDKSESDPLKLYRTIRPMGHEIQRIAHFVKRNGKWRMKDVSMSLGKSLGVTDTETELVQTSLRIMKVVVKANDEEIEITDPLEFFQDRKSVFTFENGTEVTVKVYVENSTDNPVYVPAGTDQTEVVRLHHARHRFRKHHKIKYFSYLGQEEGINVYKGKWVIGQWPNIHHAVIDVIDNGTVFDDDINKYPYNSTTWSTPYKVIVK